MKTGYAPWLAKSLATLIISAPLVSQTPLKAEELAAGQVNWPDRVSVETDDCEIIDTSRYVSVWGVRLGRFAQLQRLKLLSTLSLDSSEDAETLMVLQALQGGVSQGEQPIMPSPSKQGIEVFGPHEKDFESLDMIPATEVEGSLFLQYGDRDGPHTSLKYFAGQLAERRQKGTIRFFCPNKASRYSERCLRVFHHSYTGKCRPHLHSCAQNS